MTGFVSQTTLCIVYKDGEYPQEPYVPTIFENYAGMGDEGVSIQGNINVCGFSNGDTE